jgi:predicted aspartyl protease
VKDDWKTSRTRFLILQKMLIGVICIFAMQHPFPASAAVPSTRPTVQRTVIATTQPVAIPYKLTDTNHILVRLKINGKGPFNFIVDTGAPVMILRVPAAQKLGLKPNSRGFANLNEVEIEGGMILNHVQCLVDTPYQIEGMNAIGASGVDLDGLLGYGVLSRFRMQIDMTRDHMIWTPVKFTPPPFVSSRSSRRGPTDQDEDHLESMGGLLKVLGPLVKPADLEPQYRGVVGVQLGEAHDGVTVLRVLGDSPADRAGILPGDQLISVNRKPVRSIADARTAMANTLTGQSATLIVRREQAELTFHLICAEGL